MDSTHYDDVDNEDSGSDSDSLCSSMEGDNLAFDITTEDDSDESDYHSIDMEEFEGDDSDDEYLYNDIPPDEIDYCKSTVSGFDFNDVDEAIFTPVEMEKLKDKEKDLLERNAKGYYRCKVKHAKLYEEISTAYAPYITKPMLLQLSHGWSTQKNEAMNTSVASYAPKHKHYSTTTSLDTRVAISGGVQVLGYHTFWSRIFHQFGLVPDEGLKRCWIERD